VVGLAATGVDTAGAHCVFDGLSRKVRGFLDLRDGTATRLLLPATR